MTKAIFFKDGREILGSDGEHKLDGRLGLENAMEQAKTHARNLKKVQKIDRITVVKNGLSLTEDFDNRKE